MTDTSKTKLRNLYNSTLLTAILALLGYIGVMIQTHLNQIDIKIEKTATIHYVDRQDDQLRKESDYLRLHIIESHTMIEKKLDAYIKQINKSNK